MLLQEEWPKIKFYLFGIAARPTEKLAAQIILFAFQTIVLIKQVWTQKCAVQKASVDVNISYYLK
jgi:hypothetical protein